MVKCHIFESIRNQETILVWIPLSRKTDKHRETIRQSNWRVDEMLSPVLSWPTFFRHLNIIAQRIERITTMNEIHTYKLTRTLFSLSPHPLSIFYAKGLRCLNTRTFWYELINSLNIVHFIFKDYKILSIHAKYIFALIIFTCIFKMPKNGVYLEIKEVIRRYLPVNI